MGLEGINTCHMWKAITPVPRPGVRSCVCIHACTSVCVYVCHKCKDLVCVWHFAEAQSLVAIGPGWKKSEDSKSEEALGANI